MSERSPAPVTRDLFGRYPLYYNTKNADRSESLAALTSVDLPVDPATIVEYLAFGTVWDVEATFFADIRRVPPGATLQPDGRIERRAPEYFDLLDLPASKLVDRFWLEFADAVERSAGHDVVISLSGGLDSAAMAVAAVERFGRERVRGATIGYRDDFDDPEPDIARTICEHLGIEWVFVCADSTDAFAGWTTTDIWPTEPTPASGVEWDARMGDDPVLWGLGGDSLLRGDRDHYARRLRTDGWTAAAADMLRTVVVHGHRPALGLQRSLRRRKPPSFEQPDWLRRSDGWEAIVDRYQTLPESWTRGWDELFAPDWSFQFESVARVNAPDAPRYVFPFFDETFARFAAHIPTAPWFIDKEILRAALRGRLPDSVRLRPKTPVAGASKSTLTPAAVMKLQAALAGAEDYLDPSAFDDVLQPGVVESSALNPALRAAGVGRWLAARSAV